MAAGKKMKTEGVGKRKEKGEKRLSKCIIYTPVKLGIVCLLRPILVTPP